MLRVRQEISPEAEEVITLQNQVLQKEIPQKEVKSRTYKNEDTINFVLIFSKIIYQRNTMTI